MKTTWIACLLGMTLPLVAAETQKGAEQIKKPIKAAIVDVKKIDHWDGQAVGNVEVTYADGSRDHWTTFATAQLPKVADDGVVGWIDCSTTEHGKPQLALYQNIPLSSHLVLCNKGKITAKIQSGKPFIEDWGFTADGKHVVVKSRAAHGPAVIERFSRADATPQGSVKGFAEDAPDWAKAFLDK